MTSPLRLLAFALLLAPSLLPAAENQRFTLERPYPWRKSRNLTAAFPSPT